MKIERPRCVIEALVVNSRSVVGAEEGADAEVGASNKRRRLQLQSLKRTRQSQQQARTMPRSCRLLLRKKMPFNPKQLKRLI